MVAPADTDAKPAEYAHPDRLVTTDRVAANLGSERGSG